MSLFTAQIDLKKAFKGAERVRGVEDRTVTFAVDGFMPVIKAGGEMTPSRWVDPEYTTLTGAGMAVDVKVPYEAVEVLYKQAQDTRKTVDLREKNWEILSRQYHDRTGPFCIRT